MKNTILRRSIGSSISAVRAELRQRGFKGEEIDDFIEKSNFQECLNVLDFIATDREFTSVNTRYRFAMIASMCALRDRKRILYGLEKRNVRTVEKLDELAKHYRVNFWDRCSKVVNKRTKRRATEQLLRQQSITKR